MATGWNRDGCVPAVQDTSGCSSAANDRRCPNQQTQITKLQPDEQVLRASQEGDWAQPCHTNLKRQDRLPTDPPVYVLDTDEIGEIDFALEDFKCYGLDGDCVNRSNFGLPRLQHRLQDLSHELHRGRGVCILRGLKCEDYSTEDGVLIFLAISDYIGGRRGRQNDEGLMLSHITEMKRSKVPREARHVTQTNASMWFHNDDACDILALQTRCAAASGGKTMIASSSLVLGALFEARPDVLDLLKEPNWPVVVFVEEFPAMRLMLTLFRQKSESKNPRYSLRPLLFHEHGYDLLNFDPGRVNSRLHGGSGIPGVPRLTDVQEEALEILLATARKYEIEVSLQSGDLLYINNFAHLHARQAFRNDDSTNRHLVRLWLRNDEIGWHVPHLLRSSWDAIFGFREDLEELYPIEPPPLYCPPIYAFPSN
ncbi:MAG: hypothetical protein M1820_002498 [Bogoriella megaspora]|nr:MAG: hypothetical protein M1820_002498 [Bogoriella megaspora]